MAKPATAGIFPAFILSLCSLNLLQAQETAFKIPSKKTFSDNEPRKGQKDLVDILNELEIINSISFAYQKKYLSGKYAIYKPFKKGDLEVYLKEILTPHGLGFKRLESIAENIYVIYPVEAKSESPTVPYSSGDLQPETTAQHAGSYIIHGTVMSDDDSSVPGVNIVLKGTGTGTVTDEDGNFSIEIPEDQQNILVFSYIGFTTQEIPVDHRHVVRVMLKENIQPLSEVVVTALGLSRDQRALGYAVSTITADQITASGNTNFASAMYGKAPGVRIRTAPGGATSAVTMQIRGFNSLNYNMQPLYVIDGVLLRDANEKGAAGINNDDYFTDSRIRGNGILDISPADIETLTVLKGASATALYGSDAASGVVVITTKKGSKKTGMGIDLSYNITLEEVAFTPRYQNTYGPGFSRERNIALGADEEGWVPVDTNNDGIANIQRPLFESYTQFGPRMEGQEVLWWDGAVRKYSPQPDNYKDFYRKGFNSLFNVAFNNQMDKLSYRFSYTHNDYKGIQVGGDLERNTFNLNSSFKLSNRVSTDLVLTYVNSVVHNRPLKINRLMGSYNGFFSRAEDMSLFFDKYKTSEGYKWVPYDQAVRNPEEALWFTTPRGYEVMDFLWKQLRNSEDEFQNRLVSSFTLNYNIFKNLRFRGRIGSDLTGVETETKEHNEYAVLHNVSGSTGSYGITNGRYSIFYTDALLNYSKKITPDIKFSMDGGFQLRDEKYRNETTQTSGGLVIENWFSLHNSFNPTLTTTQTRSKILKYAFLGIVNFSYKDFLFLEGTGRQEYSSTLPPVNNRYFYPSVNVGFIFSDVLKLPKLLNYGKARASFGVVGNAPPAYEANVLYNLKSLQTVNGSVVSASASSNYGNNQIRPERKHEIELGIEARLFQHKLGVDLTYYNSRTKDQILKLDLPGSIGADEVLENIGELHSQGWELALSTTPISGKLIWNTIVNVAVNSTRLHHLTSGLDELVFKDFEGSAIRVVAEPDQRIGNIYVYPRQTDAQGNLIISDDGLYITDKTRYVRAGNLLPKVTGGINNTLRYKDISFELMLDYSFGGKIISPPLKYSRGAGMYQNTLQYRDAAHGGLPYYINSSGDKIQLSGHDQLSPDGSKVYHDGIILKGVTKEGAANTTIVDAATYYINTFDWGNNAWNEAGAVYDNSYIKIREAVLGYNLPKAMAEKLHFRSIRVSLIGRNLFYLWRTLENIDPESTIGTSWLNQGTDEGSSAATRSYGFAVNLSF